MKTVDAGSTGTFVYNAVGQRVQKNIGGTSYYYLHDAFGNVSVVRSASSLLEKIIPGANAKYYQNGAGWKTDYLHGNPLGTTQIVTQADTSVEEERIFYPFGILRWQSGGSQDVRFASMQERDSETVSWQNSLDWTPNRTFGENMGRWFSPDPAVAGQVPLGGDITNPQSLNRYAYALNSPTNFADPLGLNSYSLADYYKWLGQNPPVFTHPPGGAAGLGIITQSWDPLAVLAAATAPPQVSYQTIDGDLEAVFTKVQIDLGAIQQSYQWQGPLPQLQPIGIPYMNRQQMQAMVSQMTGIPIPCSEGSFAYAGFTDGVTEMTGNFSFVANHDDNGKWSFGDWGSAQIGPYGTGGELTYSPSEKTTTATPITTWGYTDVVGAGIMFFKDAFGVYVEAGPVGGGKYWNVSYAGCQ